MDGAPLDTGLDAVLLGLVFPALAWLLPQFSRDRRARAAIVTLLLWKAVTAATLVQDGWCVRILPTRPYYTDGTGAAHSWDVRADWRTLDPMCSAIMSRDYAALEEFPVWFFNLTGVNGAPPEERDLPPLAVTQMTIHGTVHTAVPGSLAVAMAADITATTTIDGERVAVDGNGIEVSAGTHAIAIDATLTGSHWHLTPLWNGASLWGQVSATTHPPTRLDVVVRPWARGVTTVLAALLLASWLFAALSRFFDVWALAWAVAASVALTVVATSVPERRWHYAMALLAAAAALPVRDRVWNLRGAFLLIGVPWLVFVVVNNVSMFGRMEFSSPGNDWWEFQRYAHRIYMDGYWLQGGQDTFWYQPLYRWIAGAIHLVVGDSTVGEAYWDGGGVLVLALFCFVVTQRVAGFRWGVLAASLALTTYMAGPGFIFVGHGLSEISSAGFIYAAALCAIAAHNGGRHLAIWAGILATLGAWTRLNNLPMALAVTAFAWPLDVPVRTLWQPRRWLDRVSTPVLWLVPTILAIGFALFAARTWYYTGRFSVLYGTQGADRSVWLTDASITENLTAMADSVWMVLSTTDPPHYHNGALPLIAGAALAALSLTGWGRLGQLPLALVLLCLSSLIGALIARGSAYAGRFSIHVIGAAVAVLTCAMALHMPHRIERKAAT